MTRIKCMSEDCLHNYNKECARDFIEIHPIELLLKYDGECKASYCIGYERRVDFVKFMEDRGLG